MSVALRWSEPALTMQAGDGSWSPYAELVNDSDSGAEIGGAPAASAVIRHADGTGVRRHSSTLVAIPSVLIHYRLDPRQARPLHVVVGLTPDDIAGLPAGRYRISEVRWGELTAPDIDLEIRG
jgi:hypothetical protein